MSDPTPIADEPVHHYDPLTDEGRTGRKTNRFLIALIIAGIVHLALFGYIYRLKIIAKFKDYSDQATKVELRKAAPPPPVLPPPAPPAPPPPPHAAVITNPDWARKPNGDEFSRYYPTRAQSLNQTGRAAISCSVTAKGTLTGCSVVSEDPPGLGFGEASLKIAQFFRMKPKTADGVPVEGGTFSTTIRWELPKE